MTSHWRAPTPAVESESWKNKRPEEEEVESSLQGFL
jgi:hypothetical protein